MSSRNVIDLAVVQLRIAMREDVGNPDVSGMRDLLSTCRCNSVKLIQSLAADFQHPLDSSPEFVICYIVSIADGLRPRCAHSGVRSGEIGVELACPKL